MGQALSKLAIAKAYVVGQCVATCSECLNLLLYGALMNALAICA